MNYLEKASLLKEKIKKNKEDIQKILQSYTSDKREKLLFLQYLISIQTGRVKFLRPNDTRDIIDRERQISEFSKKIFEVIPDSKHLVFHGTPIYNTEKILKSGRIVSGRDLWGIKTSGDPLGQFSVTTKENIQNTVIGHSDLGAYTEFLPAGTIFVLYPKDEEEYKMAQKKGYLHNIDFKRNPNRIHSLVTTSENLDRINNWLKKYKLNYHVYDYDAFIDYWQKQTINPQALKKQKTID